MKREAEEAVERVIYQRGYNDGLKAAEAENARLRAVVAAAKEWEKCWDRCWECDRICLGVKMLIEALEALEVQR